jgi:hypothetical protein
LVIKKIDLYFSIAPLQNNFYNFETNGRRSKVLELSHNVHIKHAKKPTFTYFHVAPRRELNLA